MPQCTFVEALYPESASVPTRGRSQVKQWAKEEELKGPYIGTVQHEADVPHFPPHPLQAIEVKLDAVGAIVAMDVSERGGKPVDAGVLETARLRLVRHHAFERAGVHDAVLAALDMAGLGLGDHAAFAAVGSELTRAC